jgi:hypothetical protein
MAQIERPPADPRIRSTDTSTGRFPPTHRARGLAPSLIAAAVTVSSLAALFLFPYVTRHYRYPLGWDAAATVRQVRAVSFDGLDRIGGIRAGAPLLLATLSRATGRNAFTLVSIVPALLAAIGGLGAAAMTRAALRVTAPWVPVIGFLTWAAFGGNGMMNLHLDNLLNSALTLAAFGALLAFAAHGRGLAATAVLLAGAGLAHWPFFAVAVAVYLVAVAGFVLPSIRSPEARRLGYRLLAPVAASGIFVAATFLAIPASGWLGARLGALSSSLRQRFLEGLHETHRYWAMPLAAAGAYGVARTPAPPAKPQARRLFLLLMGAWALVTLLGGLAQWAGIPTAGGRLLLYLFPVTILAATFVWWVAGWLAERGPGLVWRGLAIAVTFAAVAGFGAMTASWRSTQRPWIDPSLVQQVTRSAAYLGAARIPLDRPVVYLLGASLKSRPSIQVVRAALPPERSVRAFQTYSAPLDYLAGGVSPSDTSLPGRPEQRIVLVVQGLGPKGFRSAARAFPERVVAPGVLVLQGPLPAGPLPALVPPVAETRARALVWISATVLAILYLAGGGWSLALLPNDWVLRVALAPALGCAAVTLVAFGWDRVGLPLTGRWPLAPLVITALGGWALAASIRPRPAAGPANDPGE